MLTVGNSFFQCILCGCMWGQLLLPRPADPLLIAGDCRNEPLAATRLDDWLLDPALVRLR